MRTILAACGAIAVAGLTITAQTPQPTTQTPRPATQAATPMGQAVTATGCLKPMDGMALNTPAGSNAPTGAPGSTTGAAGTPPAGTRPAGGQYLLTNIEQGAGSMTSERPGVPTGAPAGTTTPNTGSTASSAPRAGMHSSYVLKAEGSSVNLSAHVNHKIQVTGTMQDAMGNHPTGTAPAAPGSITPGSANPSLGEAGSTAGAAHHGTMDHMGAAVLNVTAVQMIASTCP